jgi:hypothetical protein
MKLLLCILAAAALVFTGCSSVPPAEPAEKAAQENTQKEPAEEKPEVERMKFVKLLAETAAKGDRGTLRKMFVPMDIVAEIARLEGNPLDEKCMEESRKGYKEMIDCKIDGCLLCFKENDPESLEFEDSGTNEFTPEEKKEITELAKVADYISGFGDVQVYSEGRRIIGARVFRYKGTWYCTDIF